MAPRVGVLGMWHETNTYSSWPTTLDDFRAFELLAGDAIVDSNRDTGSVIGGFLDASDLDLVPLFVASAWPGGTVTAHARSTIFERILETIRAGGLDGLLLNLHGAMVSEDDDDPEGSLLEELRNALPTVPIAAVLDLHANPSTKLLHACNVVISYDTYPHVDMRERGREAARFMSRLVAGERLRTSIAKVPILAPPIVQATDANPMRGLQSRLAQRAKAAGLDRACLTGGYCYSDVARAGMSVLIVHHDDQAVVAGELLARTIRDIEDHATELRAERESPSEAVERALHQDKLPVILADTGDNIGGGSPGDGTTLLRELLRRKVPRAVVIISDAEAALHAVGLGVGATFSGLVGGKADRMHGDPVAVTGSVVRTSDGNYRTQGTWMTGREFSLGQTAVVDAGGTLVVLTERRVPPFHGEQLSCLDIEAKNMNVIVAKGAVAWRAAYGDVAGTVIEVDTPGICPVDPMVLPRTTQPMRV